VQTRWRAIGFAPRKYNQSVYDEYRALTDGFFRAKTRFYKNIRDQFSENLKAKRDLLKQAEELLNGEQTPEATEQMIQLQKTWKTIGPVARKYSDEIWKQFTDTCDAFFNRKRETERQERGERQRERGERIMQSGDKNKLSRMYEQLQQEIKTAENNILFFTGKSKSASKLVQDMQKKIDALKAQLKTLEEKLNAE
jgi:chromosome segregation ATPase